MRQSPSAAGRRLPPWLAWGGSALLLYHLAAVLLAAVDAPSGPWPPPVGMTPAPAFVRSLAEPTDYTHNRILRVAYSYRFISNRPGLSGVFFEARLADESGKPLVDERGAPLVLRFPEKEANPWVRHRQEIMAWLLAQDVFVPTQPGEIVAPAGGQVPTLDIWRYHEPSKTLHLTNVPQHLVPREQGVMRPSDLELLLARSYARYLSRKHGAAKVELVRHTREPAPPRLLQFDEPAPQAFEDLIASYGEVSR